MLWTIRITGWGRISRLSFSRGLLQTHTDATLTEARHQLGPRYGHLAVGKTGQLDRFVDLYEDWLKEHSLQHDRDNFIRWLDEGFCEYAASLELIDRPAAILAS